MNHTFHETVPGAHRISQSRGDQGTPSLNSLPRLLLLALLGCLPGIAAAAATPNIMLILPDDLGCS